MSPSSSLINSAWGEDAVHSATHCHTPPYSEQTQESKPYTPSSSWYHYSSASSLFCLAKIRNTGHVTSTYVTGKRKELLHIHLHHIIVTHTSALFLKLKSDSTLCMDLSSKRSVPYSRLSCSTHTLHYRFSLGFNRTALYFHSYKPGYRIY